MPLFRQKLKALQYPNTENFNWNDQTSYRNLVSWLEENKICFYKKPDRVLLSNISDQNWEQSFIKYLDDVECPKESRPKDKSLSSNQKAIILEWLINFSIKKKIEFSKKSAYYNEYLDKIQTEAKEKKQNENIEEISSNLPTLHENEYVIKMAQLLEVPPPSSPEETQKFLTAVARYLERKMENQNTPAPNQVDLKEFQLGFETGDQSLDSALKILRMLYVNDLRDLQSHINHMIVSAQNLTANPKN